MAIVCGDGGRARMWVWRVLDPDEDGERDCIELGEDDIHELYDDDEDSEGRMGIVEVAE